MISLQTKTLNQKTKRETSAMSEVSTVSLFSQENTFSLLSRLHLCPSHKQQFEEKEERIIKSHPFKKPDILDYVGAV